MATFGDDRLPARFWSRVVVDANGCWTWTGATTGKGYGVATLDGKLRLAHRWVYHRLVAPVDQETARGQARDHARIVSDAAGRWQIPLRRGRVAGCSVVAGGIVDHNQLGSCGGGHFDITPYAVDQVLTAARAYRARTSITAVDRRTCARLNAWRRRGRPGGHQVVVNVRRKQALQRRGVTCTAKGPVR